MHARQGGTSSVSSWTPDMSRYLMNTFTLSKVLTTKMLKRYPLEGDLTHYTCDFEALDESSLIERSSSPDLFRQLSAQSTRRASYSCFGLTFLDVGVSVA